MGDAAGAKAVWSDDDLQDFLDAEAERVREFPLGLADSSGLAWRDALGGYEIDTALTDGRGLPLTPVEADPIGGFWTFATDPGSVYVTGRRHDVYRAAAACVDAWIALEKGSYDVSADGQSFSRSQKVKHLQDLAKALRRQGRPRLGTMVRSD